ncbi:hypothetical protein A3A56_03875 [Candidatus Roizmanbacteria bacterium RIFCSPLOWO2_01_FULL_40_32]|nr:MAG: hypothetical protein A3A56_03875 [Candidatus Roizmanbacteria bacterium RIFCSPLOWO2_01_FULL_40_32]
MESRTNEEYFTKDLGEAAALVCSSVKLLRLQKEKSFFWFVFADKSLCEQFASKYWSGSLELSARQYSEALRSLKDRLFAQR